MIRRAASSSKSIKGLPGVVVFFLLFLLPVAYLLFHAAGVPFIPTSDYTDLLVSHLPNGLLLQQSITRWHTIPLWSPAILSGFPFAADPLSGLYYLPGLLALLFPLPLGFNLLVAAHLVFGGIGLYRLLRSEGLCEPAALLGGLSFAALPKLNSHLGAGHLTLLYAIAWTPWLLYGERIAAVRFDRSKIVVLSKRTTPGLVLGVIALADIRWAAYAGLLWLAFSLRLALPLKPLAPTLGRWIFNALANVVLTLLIAAPLLLPLAEYTRLATRSALTAADNLTLSLPPAGLFALFYPTFPGSAESVLYPGAGIAALALLALTVPPLRKRAGFWLIIAAAALIWALGANLPVLDLLTRLPGLNLLRVPSRALFLTGMALCMVAGYAVEYLLAMPQEAVPPPVKNEVNRKDRYAALVFFGVTVFVVLFGLMAIFAVPKPLARILFGWGALFFLCAALLIGLARAGKIGPRALTVLLFSACLIDTIAINGLLLEFHSLESTAAASQPVIEAIRSKAGPEPFRVYSPSYSIPQHAAQAAGLQLADGVDPLQLASYVNFMVGPGGATGTPSAGYSVTLPPHTGADPATDTQAYLPDAQKLGLLNVRYVVAGFPVTAPGLALEGNWGSTYLYTNALALPRAWVQAADAPPGQEIRSEARVTEQPNRVVVESHGPGLLVLSEMAYPGWVATVDGAPVSVETVGGLLRGVRIGPGSHHVVFDFRPVTVYLGLMIGALAWLIWLGLWIAVRRQHG